MRNLLDILILFFYSKKHSKKIVKGNNQVFEGCPNALSELYFSEVQDSFEEMKSQNSFWRRPLGFGLRWKGLRRCPPSGVEMVQPLWNLLSETSNCGLMVSLRSRMKVLYIHIYLVEWSMEQLYQRGKKQCLCWNEDETFSLENPVMLS